jgi:hypothetical protein
MHDLLHFLRELGQVRYLLLLASMKVQGDPHSRNIPERVPTNSVYSLSLLN